MDKLVDEIGDRESHRLMGLLDNVTLLVLGYEERNIEIPSLEPQALLRFLMGQHSMQPIDLVEILGSRSNVSLVLNGTREIDTHEAHALAQHFRVPPVVFT